MRHMNIEKIPRVNWPASKGVYKVIQLEMEGTPYLRFGQGLSRTSHGAILEEMLNALEIPYGKMWIENHSTGIVGMGQRRERYTVPNPKSDRYTAVGMGFAQLSTEKKEAEFYGRSEDYHLEINQAHLDMIKISQRDWQIRVRGE